MNHKNIKNMKYINLFEEFQEGPMQKPKSFFSKIVKGAKDVMGVENKEDRKSLESLHKTISDMPSFVKNVREIKPGVIVAWILDNSITVDKNTPEIIYKGKTLDLHNTTSEAEYLYNKLINRL